MIGRRKSKSRQAAAISSICHPPHRRWTGSFNAPLWRKAAKRAGHFSKKHNDCVANFGVQPQANLIVFVDFPCLGAHGLTHFLVWAHTDETPARVGTFVVPNKLPGIRVIENWNSLGMRASGSHDVDYTDVEIPLENVIDLVDPSVAQQDNRAHAAITLALTALYLGVAEAAQEAFIRFAHERVPTNLGHPIACSERFVTLSGEIDLLVSGARQIIFDALKDKQAEADKHIRARLLAGRQLRDAVQIAVRGIGNPGLGNEMGLERHFRDIQSVLVHAPREDTSISILGRAAFERWKSEKDTRLAPPVNLTVLKTARP